VKKSPDAKPGLKVLSGPSAHNPSVTAPNPAAAVSSVIALTVFRSPNINSKAASLKVHSLDQSRRRAGMLDHLSTRA
jgi:hypothetical protein